MDVLYGRDAQHRPGLEFQGEEDVVVVADGPPRVGPSQATTDGRVLTSFPTRRLMIHPAFHAGLGVPGQEPALYDTGKILEKKGKQINPGSSRECQSYCGISQVPEVAYTGTPPHELNHTARLLQPQEKKQRKR